MKTKDFQDALSLIEDYAASPIECLHRILSEKGLPFRSLEHNEEYLESLINSIDSSIIDAVNQLMDRLDRLNRHFVKQLANIDCTSEFGIEFRLLPIDRVGIYIPRRMPSSAFTFLSAAKNAGCKELVVFLPIDDQGDLDPLSLYVARHYGAKILGGPARLGFPSLSFGFPENVRKCDLVCGPCGNKMNILKSQSALIANVSTDMAAGASDLTIVADKPEGLDKVKLDLFSQLEHGPDSAARLIVVGDNLASIWKKQEDFNLLNNEHRIMVHYVSDPGDINALFQTISSETLMFHSDDPEKYIHLLKYCGVAYFNMSSTLGDYGIIGRGCADPTGNFARGQSGISPLTFLKVAPLISGASISNDIVKAGLMLSKYEKMDAHARVIEKHIASKE